MRAYFFLIIEIVNIRKKNTVNIKKENKRSSNLSRSTINDVVCSYLKQN